MKKTHKSVSEVNKNAFGHYPDCCADGPQWVLVTAMEQHPYRTIYLWLLWKFIWIHPLVNKEISILVKMKAVSL